MKRIVQIFSAVVVVFAGYIFLAGEGFLGNHQGPGVIDGSGVPAEEIAKRVAKQQTVLAQLNDSLVAAQAASSAAEPEKVNTAKQVDKQILFGDLHVHTTYSNDAFMFALPIMQGEGTHPPADACDYARYCSALDFWSINDHAISITPRLWEETKASVRQCNDLTDPTNPDLVTFLGFEWTHADPTDRNKHYGHKNVVFKHVDEARVPDRPIYAKTELGPAQINPSAPQKYGLPLLKFPNAQPYLDHNLYVKEMLAVPECAENVHTSQLPSDCREGAADPATLFQKLDEGGFESMVIPHGNTWGLYTPAGTTWDKQLVGHMHDEDRQIMIEVFSGHGNSEEYRDWRAVSWNEEGEMVCPPRFTDYTPMCRRAGEIIKERCLTAGEAEEICLGRELEAQQNYLDTLMGMITVPGAEISDWQDAGQCSDCFLPSFNYRPGGSAQYALAVTNFDDPANPRRFKFGFMASSDTHTARGGNGYKELDRRENTEAAGAVDAEIDMIMKSLVGEPEPFSKAYPATLEDQRQAYPRGERLASFFYTGGIIAVHSEGRDRQSIWDGFQRKEVYGTSGDRILLWFDLLNPNGDSDAIAPMGSELTMATTPKFRVKAVGAFKQKPGCPKLSTSALSVERLDRLCRGECFNPTDERKIIDRIEVIRIRPQATPNEPMSGLIEDVWLTHTCDGNSEGCVFEFDDPQFQQSERDTVYYVRAIERASPTVNGGHLRCERDEAGQCIKVNDCRGSSLYTDYEDDCLEDAEERAWSSPIFIDFESANSVLTKR